MTDLFRHTEIEGCLTFKNRRYVDDRGAFTKVYSEEIFNLTGIKITIAEIFFSTSKKNVLRGMHFQTPPHDQAKIVSCLQGRILDVVLDLRKSSKSFGSFFSLELTKENETTIIIPKGCAHGFYSLEDDSIVSYAVETNYSREADQGVLWNSFGFKWPSTEPIISERDRKFPEFKQYASPF